MTDVQHATGVEQEKQGISPYLELIMDGINLIKNVVAARESTASLTPQAIHAVACTALEYSPVMRDFFKNKRTFMAENIRRAFHIAVQLRLNTGRQSATAEHVRAVIAELISEIETGPSYTYWDEGEGLKGFSDRQVLQDIFDAEDWDYSPDGYSHWQTSPLLEILEQPGDGDSFLMGMEALLNAYPQLNPDRLKDPEFAATEEGRALERAWRKTVSTTKIRIIKGESEGLSGCKPYRGLDKMVPVVPLGNLPLVEAMVIERLYDDEGDALSEFVLDTNSAAAHAVLVNYIIDYNEMDPMINFSRNRKAMMVVTHILQKYPRVIDPELKQLIEADLIAIVDAYCKRSILQQATEIKSILLRHMVLFDAPELQQAAKELANERKIDGRKKVSLSREDVALNLLAAVGDARGSASPSLAFEEIARDVLPEEMVSRMVTLASRGADIQDFVLAYMRYNIQNEPERHVNDEYHPGRWMNVPYSNLWFHRHNDLLALFDLSNLKDEDAAHLMYYMKTDRTDLYEGDDEEGRQNTQDAKASAHCLLAVVPEKILGTQNAIHPVYGFKSVVAWVRSCESAMRTHAWRFTSKEREKLLEILTAYLEYLKSEKVALLWKSTIRDDRDIEYALSQVDKIASYLTNPPEQERR
ncbi:hypothetical protein COY07_01530, partial [Candidatus Peregrinibacteria bacterium CG_4_10_14_0_2_um_filter_43_11]